MAKPPGLRQRGGSWEIRKRVPLHLRPVLPTEIVKSFGGVPTKHAYRLGWLELAAIERRFEEAEKQLALAALVSHPRALSEGELIEVSRRFVGDLEADAQPIPLDHDQQAALRETIVEEALGVSQPTALEDATLQGVARGFAERAGINLVDLRDLFPFFEAIQAGWLEHLNRQLARLGGATVATVNPAYAGVDASYAAEGGSIALKAAIKMYIDAPARSGNAASSRKMDRSRLRLLEELVGSERSLGSVTKADMRAYLEALTKLPANYSQRFRKMSLLQAIEAGAACGAPTMSPATIKRNLEAARSFFTWAERQELIGKNPALHVEGPKVPKKSNRRPLSPEELQLLLAATPLSAKVGKEWMYWAVRIGLLQGFRMTEILGLQVGDLFQQGDVWGFRLRPNKYRDLKTEETARDVPVHPRLIELGILDLGGERAPDELLIPGVPVGRGTAFNAAGKQLRRIVREKVTQDRDAVFHSLRHNIRDAMRNGGLPRSVELRLGGWASESNDVMDGYGQGHRLEVLKDWIVKVDYDGVEIT